MAKKSKEEKQKEKELKTRDIKFSDYPYLVAIKPRERYVFHSDYFEIDNSVATIMSFHHMEGATDGYPAFWGIGRIPMGLDNDITTVSFEQIRKMTKNWVDDHTSVAESVNKMNTQETNSSKSTQSLKNKNNRKAKDLEEIAKELMDNAAYLQVHFKLLVKAPTLEKLDDAITKIGRRCI